MSAVPGTLAFATVLVALATTLPLWRNPHWLVRSMDFPRLQIVAIAAALLALQAALLDWGTSLSYVLFSVTAACLVWQAWWIAPYTRLWPCEVVSSDGRDPCRTLSLVTANVLMTNRNSGALLERVQALKPDVLLTLESDQWWQDRLAVLEDDMPYRVNCPLDNLYGMHLLSRLPIKEAKTSYLVEADVPSIHALLTLPCGTEVRLHCMHPAPPSPTENEESAERDAELIVLARSIDTAAGPVIVTGDLNDVAWSATTRLFRKISGLLDPRVGRGFFNTFHAHYPFLRWPLDHVFHSAHFTLTDIQRLPPFGSDHFALHTVLSYSPGEEPAQQGLQDEPEDRERAAEIARSKGVSQAEVPTL